MKDQDVIFEIFCNLDSEHTIRCSTKNCDVSSSISTEDGYDAAEFFFNEEGWKATRLGNVYCPSCVAKKLKPRKKLAKRKK